MAGLGALGEVAAVSGLYRSRPVGGPPQPDYLNAALRLDTALGPEALLARLHALEAQAGRVRRERWGPRTLDLDLIGLGELVRATPTLTLPHPRAHERAFVLAPLAEVAPAWAWPLTGETVAAALARVGQAGLERLENDDWWR